VVARWRSSGVKGSDRAVGVEAQLWARLAALEGKILETRNRRRFLVVAVTDEGVYVRNNRTHPANLLGRRALRAALPFVVAGKPLPRLFRDQAARLAAILRAARVAPDR
jgi:hypothetical protein